VVYVYKWLCSFEFNTEKYEKGNDKDWFYISERTKTGKAGRSNKRVDNGGYWSATVAAQKINAGNGIVGYKTSLEYYVGKQSNSVKGDWLMQEYWFESSDDNNNEKVRVSVFTWIPSY